ncbi:MAG: fibronectin type III domain-containing protein [Actinobacteria bacterium]|nr:fibronectin type III domain-containing protein [Actinomycetota bacterium]
MARWRHVLVPALVALVITALLSTFGLSRAVAETPSAAAPTALTVSARSTVAIFTWSGTADRYLLEVATDPGFATPLVQETAGTVAVVNDLQPGIAYLARVSAVTDAGPGPASDQVAFTTPVEGFQYAAPVVALSSTDSASMSVTWPAVAEDAHYVVELSADDSFADPKSKDVTASEARFTKLTAGHTYSVRVRVVDAASLPLSEWSDVATGKVLVSAPLVVGSYNILKAKDRAWSKRKPALVSTILGESPDVVGLQEATPRRTATGRRQYDDLTAALGSEWALTDDSKDTTGEVRTIYNTSRLTLVTKGHYAIAGSKRFRGIQRYITWAEFIQKSTGKHFLFVNTHFVPRTSRASDPHRVSAARQLVALLKRVNTAGLPVVIVGDFNTGMNRTTSNRVYTTIVGAGYRDPVGTSTRLGHAEKTIRANLKTVNGYRKVAPRDNSQPLVDHIFVSPMEVKEWEVVAKLNSAGRFIGTIPSDHNMLRATVELP